MVSEIKLLKRPSSSPVLENKASNPLLKKRLLKSHEKTTGFLSSPTDKMLSPCTQKLKNHRNMFLQNAKVSKINFSKSSKKTGSDLKKLLFEANVEKDILSKPRLIKSNNGNSKLEDEIEIDEEEALKHFDVDEI